jgi:hypothetical protein
MFFIEETRHGKHFGKKPLGLVASFNLVWVAQSPCSFCLSVFLEWVVVLHPRGMGGKSEERSGVYIGGF